MKDENGIRPLQTQIRIQSLLHQMRIRVPDPWKGGRAESLPGVEILYGDSVRVEVDGEGRDVSHICVVHQRSEIHRATVQEIQDLNKWTNQASEK